MSRVQSAEPRRLPVIAEQSRQSAEDDPLLLLRGGRFARWFAICLGAIGLVWIVGARVDASDLDGSVLLVHNDLAAEFGALGETPPPAGIEELPPRAEDRKKDESKNENKNENKKKTPPPAGIEELPARA
ncbi:MAG TPA: hypothetical protein ENK31_06065, partial [Nannocystis exedens]|nr:hypothetical protein [Nannocystis exedens]